MANFSALLESVLPEVKGCPKAVAVREIRNASIELCRQAPVWLAMLEELETNEEEAVVDLSMDIPSGSIVDKVLRVTCEGKMLAPTVMSSYHESRFVGSSAMRIPQNYASPSPSVLLLTPVPDAVYELEAMVSLMPTATATTIDDDVFNVWGSAFVNGALHRLMRIQSTPWGNESMSGFYMRMFQEDLRRARADSVTAHTTMNGQAKSVRFG